VSERDYELEMLVYCKLAQLADQKRQLLSRDRFLLLAGEAATRAGFPSVADRCRQLVVGNSPHHVVAQFPTLADVLRSDEGRALFQRLQRYCPFEKAEYLLSELGIPAESLRPSDQPADQAALQMLQMQPKT